MDPKTLMRLKESLCVFSLLLMLVGKKAAWVSAVAPTMADCEPRSCGNGVNVSYPFWLRGQQPSYCGFPPFMIICGNGSYSPVLEILGHKFYALNIFYHNQSVLLTAVEFFDDSCPLPYENIGFNSSIYPFSISSLNRNVYFLLNCSNELWGYESIACARNLAYFGGEYNMSTRLDLASLGCVLDIVPVVEYFNASNGDVAALLRRGWLLDWASPDCTECTAGGGRCGFNDTMGRFMCICPDGVRSGSCTHVGHLKAKIKGIIIGVSAATGVFLLLCTCYRFYKHKKKRQFPPSSKSLSQSASLKPSLMDPEMDSALLQTHVFSYAELEEATNKFDASNTLGDGGFCTVYKGKIQDGRTVAVKRLYENNYRRVEQFMNEIQILSRLRHQRLVILYGCTSHQSRELLLVYEFVSNGTLAHHLHGSPASQCILTWPMRLRIAIETADALAYLHAVNPPVIHRDVKTNNILLDSNFHVKVADFGLSRLIPKDVTHISTAPQGTPGYLDPEYHQCFQLTDKSDVYSFGVVLFELITSKPAVDMTRNRSEINLANMAITRIQKGELEQLVDAALGYQSDEVTRKMITMVAEVAFRCLQSDGDMRPPIKEVLEVLQAIESDGNRPEKKEHGVAESRDDAELLKNTEPFSPDSVMNRWTSRSTTPQASE
ncbi:LEAF RUST 10 DISEASE-RESISTANCE LOCUS RECEPTOR-LIKE PROTEIN KINASE-like 1.2 isoform X3 [Musa acuminata AAA Group]|uniref:LEAF RUST 10 DISEASE-RESISTANCE LOCUS RECEPTOR-LIKE PROTEIN KINASE-like 1.2 isoform X3 n=1 Tax=Musa acuminata AAA Group TaxID=214697 RepID=UPI0031E2813A